MRVFLDDQPVVLPDGVTIAQALAAGADAAVQAGRTVVQVSADGARWGPAELEQAQSRPSPAVRELRLESADSIELVCQTFQDAGAALNDAERLQQEAAHLLQADELIPALQKLSDAFSIWINVQEAVTMGSSLAGVDLDDSPPSPSPGGRTAPPIHERIDRLNAHLKSVRAALEAKDTVALSDTLLYDLPEVVQEWRVMLDDLRAQVRSAG